MSAGWHCQGLSPVATDFSPNTPLRQGYPTETAKQPSPYLDFCIFPLRIAVPVAIAIVLGFQCGACRRRRRCPTPGFPGSWQ
jgi:hypothetical protein